MDIFNNAQQAWLVLEDGTVYEGYGLGSSEDAIGELVFNTSVVGFQEILTDPANAKTIEKFLGSDFKVMSSYGHIRDLKKKELDLFRFRFSEHHEVVHRCCHLLQRSQEAF